MSGKPHRARIIESPESYPEHEKAWSSSEGCRVEKQASATGPYNWSALEEGGLLPEIASTFQSLTGEVQTGRSAIKQKAGGLLDQARSSGLTASQLPHLLLKIEHLMIE